MKNLIQELKDNEKPFGLMSEEMQEKAAQDLGVANFRVWHGSGWGEIPTGFSRKLTYRLRPDYEDEPEIEEWPVFKRNGILRYKCNLADGNDPGSYLDCAVREVNFIGFKFEDGSWHDQPIKPVNSSGRLEDNFTIGDIERGVITILHATHVLFRRK